MGHDAGSISLERVTPDSVSSWQTVCRQTFMETFSAQNTEENMKRFLEEGFSTEILLQQIDNPSSLISLVKWKDEVAGYLQLNIDDAQSEPMGSDTLEIQRIYVLQAFQKLGIGNYLIEMAYEQAHKHGKSKVWLGVWEHNIKALAFYARHEFHKIGSHTFQLGDDPQVDFILLKNL